MFKLSEFKKQMLMNELINGKLSRESAKILSRYFKTAETDYMAALFKRLLIKKALKSNFLEP